MYLFINDNISINFTIRIQISRATLEKCELSGMHLHALEDIFRYFEWKLKIIDWLSLQQIGYHIAFVSILVDSDLLW